MLLSGGRGVSNAGAPEDFRGRAAAFSAQCFEEIDRLDRAVAGPLLRQRDDTADARRDQDALPEAFLAAAERSPDLGMRIGCVNAIGGKCFHRRRVAFFKQCHQQMLGTDVILTVISAFLLCYAEHASRRRTKVGEHAPYRRENIGATRFERATSSSRTKRSTKLSHAPRNSCGFSQGHTALLSKDPER